MQASANLSSFLQSWACLWNLLFFSVPVGSGDNLASGCQPCIQKENPSTDLLAENCLHGSSHNWAGVVFPGLNEVLTGQTLLSKKFAFSYPIPNKREKGTGWCSPESGQVYEGQLDQRHPQYTMLQRFVWCQNVFLNEIHRRNDCCLTFLQVHKATVTCVALCVGLGQQHP